MLIAGEASGDLLAAELVGALRRKVLANSQDFSTDVQPLRTALAPRFFGAGGPRMAAAGVELAFDLTEHSVIGLAGVLRHLLKFRRLFRRLLALARDRQPEVIIGVDYGGFNLRFARAIRNHVRRHRKEFTPWNPILIQYVSPQVWASRPGRAYRIAQDHDLLLSIIPFEKDWYARRVPQLRVQFVGHPMAERFSNLAGDAHKPLTDAPFIVLLPGSRRAELRRHAPVMLEAFAQIQRELPNARARMVLPEDLVPEAKLLALPPGVTLQTGNVAEALAQADLALAKTGTVTLECACFGVPAVTLYKVSWAEFQAGKRLVTVKTLTMPNLLAGEMIYPEFVQHDATPENLARAALELLRDAARRQLVKTKLAQVVASLGGPGASERAAQAIVELLP